MTNRKGRPKPTGDSRKYDKRAPSTHRAKREATKTGHEVYRTSRSTQADFNAKLAVAKTGCSNCGGPGLVWKRGKYFCAHCLNLDGPQAR